MHHNAINVSHWSLRAIPTNFTSLLISYANTKTLPSEQHSSRCSHVWGNKRAKKKMTNSRHDIDVGAILPHAFSYARVLKTVKVFNLGFPSK
jgi:hypothetical protein